MPPISQPEPVQNKSFSLRSLFLWCSVAALLLAIVGMGYRGIDWAAGASWGLLGACITMLLISTLYWLAYACSLLFDLADDLRKPAAANVASGSSNLQSTATDELTIVDGSSEETMS